MYKYVRALRLRASTNELVAAEFKGEKLVQRHMDRLGGVERLHEQIYSAVLTKRQESLDMALVSYGRSQGLCTAEQSTGLFSLSS